MRGNGHCCFFFRNQSEFYQFVNAISADGGGDAPEDIMGGLKVALRTLSWRSTGSRVSSISIRHLSYYVLLLNHKLITCL